MAREDEYEVAVGDMVLEYAGSDRHTEGEVTKIGPKLVHVTRWGKTTAYIKETQQRRDGYPGYFHTLKQQADLARETAAKGVLRAHGVGVGSYVHPQWTVDQLERLVEAVAAIRNPSE